MPLAFISEYDLGSSCHVCTFSATPGEIWDFKHPSFSKEDLQELDVPIAPFPKEMRGVVLPVLYLSGS